VVVEPVQAVAAFGMADSAESRGMADMGAAITAAALSGIAACLGADSTESLGISCTGMVAVPVYAGGPCTIADSTESRGTTHTGVVAEPVQAVASRGGCVVAVSARQSVKRLWRRR